VQLKDGLLLLSPSDVTAYLGCEHLTTLSLGVARGELARREGENEQAQLIFRKGREHEAAYLARLRAEGNDVREISLEPDRDWDRAARETEQAIADGVDVVYQGVLQDGRWRGQADFLERQADGTYEAVDTKLARSAKPAYILQLCFYSDRLAAIQGVEPAWIHVLLGSGERASFRPQEFAAYARRVQGRLEEFVENGRETRPYPCDHCGICEFKALCDAEWKETDSLCLVAGVGRREMTKLEPTGITTLAGLAGAAGPAGLNAERFEKVQRQARLQLQGRETEVPVYKLLSTHPDTGFALLPDPSPGDLFFDIEGNPFWDTQGSLEYLWGVTDADDSFTSLWAQDHASEQAALEAFVDGVHARLREDPEMHVYHFAAYEVTALRRLMGRYGTREAEVDDLLRRGVFVDLLKVVRGGLVASVPGYGLKELEVFLPFVRTAEIRDGGTSIVEHERYIQTRDPAILDAIALYNKEDCVATRLLRDWLLALRAEAGPIPPPEPVEPKETPPVKVERAALRAELLEAGEELAAQLLDYHDRERKPVWWAFFDRVEMLPDELVEDADSIGALAPTGDDEPAARSVVHFFTFPAQEHKLRLGDSPFDPATRKHAGEIVALDRDGLELELKRGPSLESVPLPEALIPGRPYDTDAQEAALTRLGRSLLARDRRYPGLESVLRREPFDRPVQTNDLAAMEELLLSLDGGQLVIQGPPGSGKTWTSGRLIARLLREGKRVGVASTSHKAIHKLLAEVEAAGISVGGVKKATAGNAESFYEGERIENVTDAAGCGDAPLLGGTAWLFARGDLDGSLDYLFIDEAGQVSLADALAMGTAARNLVLVGDPLQLAQVLQGSHPHGAAASVLTHLLGEHATIPEDRGIFLERTFRLHPDVCSYISEEFYEGRLRHDPRTEERGTPFGTGLRFIEVAHEGHTQECEEEAEAVGAEVKRLLAAGVAAADVMVVAPYNAQVNLLRERLPEGVRVGTVDKFQGQEAKVVLYSLASSSGEDVPRGLEFLLSRNRLNVAISRAQCLAYLVASPRLLEVNCRTIDQMRLANALCRFVELAV
jgi:predicted RecB family nuclease